MPYGRIPEEVMNYILTKEKMKYWEAYAEKWTKTLKNGHE